MLFITNGMQSFMIQNIKKYFSLFNVLAVRYGSSENLNF